jgi:hypothetical protein
MERSHTERSHTERSQIERSQRAASGRIPGRAGLALAIVALTGLTACGGSSSPANSASPASNHRNTPAPAGSATAPAGFLLFTGTIRVRGAATEQKSFTFLLDKTTTTSTCAQVGSMGTGAPAGLKPQFDVPTPAAGGSVFILAGVVPYTGPGSYGRPAVLAGGGTDIRIGPTSYNALAPGASVSVTVSADGSGTFAFAGATPTGATRPTLSGTVTWTCG